MAHRPDIKVIVDLENEHAAGFAGVPALLSHLGEEAFVVLTGASWAQKRFLNRYKIPRVGVSQVVNEVELEAADWEIHSLMRKWADARTPVILLVSNDGGFASAIRYCRGRGCNVYVAPCRSPIARALRDSAAPTLSLASPDECRSAAQRLLNCV